MSWDVTSPGDSDVVSQYPANERSARSYVKGVFAVDHHEAEDANVGKHDQATFVDLVADPTYAAGQVGVWNNGGVLKYRVASGTVKSVAAIEDTVAKAGDTMTGALLVQLTGANADIYLDRTDGAFTRLRGGGSGGVAGTANAFPFDLRSDDIARMRLHADGGVTVPWDATGGSQGAGSLNANALFQGGVAVDAFASGTRMVFQQNTAPTGWTKDTTLPANSAFRFVHVVSGGGTGGSVNFDQVFVADRGVAGTALGHALTVAELPSHQHTVDEVVSGAGAVSGLQAGTGAQIGTATALSTGSGAAHTHTIDGFANLAVKYIDFIVATKD